MFKYIVVTLIVLAAAVWIFRPLREGFEEEEEEEVQQEETSQPQVKTLKSWLEEVAPNFFDGYMKTLRGISQIYDKIIATWAETMAEGRQSAQYIPEVKIQMIEEAKMSFPDYNTDLLEATRLYESGGEYKETAQKFAASSIFKYTPDSLKAQLGYFQKKLYAMAKKVQGATNDSSQATAQMASAPAGLRSECKNQGFIDYPLRVLPRTQPGVAPLDPTIQPFINYPELPPPSEDMLRAPFLAFRQVFNNDTMSTLNTLVDTCSRLVRRLDGISDDAEAGEVKPPPAPC